MCSSDLLQRGHKIAEGAPEHVREYLLEPAQLCFTVPADQSAVALERLRAAGFDAQGAGSRLWVEAAAGRKLEAIELLTGSGVRIIDLDVETDGGSSHTSPDHARAR